MRQKWFTQLVLLMAFGWLVAGCDTLMPRAQPTATAPVVEEVAPVVSATGVVVPVDSVLLSMQMAGVVAEVLVAENQVVRAGQVLVRLEGQESMDAAEAAARLELAAAEQALEDWYDDPDVRAAAASQAVTTAQQAVKDAEQRLQNLRASSKQADIDQAQANLVLAQDRLDKAGEDYEPYANKPEDNLLRATYLSKMAQAQKEYDAAARYLNNLQGQANPLDLAEAEANLEMVQAQLAAAERTYALDIAGPDPDVIHLAEERLANARVQLSAAEAAPGNLVLAAPIGGTVSELNVRVGEWVAPGQPVMLLADLAHLRVETTDLNEIDVARVQIGDQVSVTFDALPAVVAAGKVIAIAPKAAAGSGVNYKVTIELDTRPPALLWGMTAFVDITVR